MGSREAAAVLDIRIEESHGASWDVASDGHVVIVRQDSDGRVNEARAWEGIAQCLLIRSGARWTADQAIALGAYLRIGLPTIH